MVSRADVGKAPSAEKAPAANAAVEKNGAAAAGGGGFKAYLPLIVNLILMPVLAYAMTAYVLVPKLAHKAGPGLEASGGDSHGAAATDAHGGGKADAAHGGEAVTGKTKVSVPLSKKTLVNVSGTMGTRYLLAEFMLVGAGPNFRAAVEKSDAELRDAAASALSAKTIGDLEKPGIRNLVRTELITVFNTILGKGMVTEIYLTEFAIQ